MAKNDLIARAALFLAWPFLVALLIPLITLGCVVAWFLIPTKLVELDL